jgi:hypothetical protein
VPQFEGVVEGKRWPETWAAAGSLVSFAVSLAGLIILGLRRLTPPLGGLSAP